jgi:hypothetical protein
LDLQANRTSCYGYHLDTSLWDNSGSKVDSGLTDVALVLASLNSTVHLDVYIFVGGEGEKEGVALSGLTRFIERY